MKKITQAKAAAMLNVSLRSVQRAAVVRKHGTPELQAKMASGELSISAAAREAVRYREDCVRRGRAAAAMPEKEFEEMIERQRTGRYDA